MDLTAAQVQASLNRTIRWLSRKQRSRNFATAGIKTPDDLVDFDETSLKQVSERPSGIPDPTIETVGGVAPGTIIACPPFTFSAKSHHRLLVATDLIRFYRTFGQKIYADAIRRDRVMRNFGGHWKSDQG